MEAKIKKIKLVAMDVDGVLTEGKIIVDSEGRDIKAFDVQDGFGMVLLRKAGIKTAIITARASQPVTFRAKGLRIDRVYQDAYPKADFYKKMLSDLDVSDDDVCYIGDDLPDLPVLKRVGFPVAVANAVDEVKDAAVYVTQRRGGCGAVRELIELILKTQGKWDPLMKGLE